ncbi:NAD(P)-binding protein [Lindgomyces ingoldianus]|uniref:NAD(P)-binding protein n=1 Tax=Lindgomyces ingoldianus TaxID=673940 RepID=A0ACB6QQ43_9PLEO|nr:NAD(P)-binding protein [Lindgomyces ingoldianus]KAF2469113.1 NAD(P)-binding protein [Lindgomyces ingoldianus]
MSSPAPLTGKIALITGASKGIGAAVTTQLASLGAKVVINYSSDAAPAEALVKKIGSDNAIAIKADAADVKEIERLVKETVEKWGRIDILMPNAGISPMKDLENTTEEGFERVMGLNVKGPYFLCQKALPHMPSGSHVILVSTSLCTLSTVTPGYLLYNTSKGAIEQMTRVLAKDLGRKGINVNAVAPGPTATDLFMRGKSEELVKTIAGWNPFNRLGAPEDIANVVTFLAGEGGMWVNGQILYTNGGMTVG